MTDDTHNGWTNRETWTIHLWLTNEEPTYYRARDLARNQDSDIEAGEVLERAFDNGEFGKLPAGSMWLDLLNCALARADWPAIGRSLREE